jgi:PIN domain nuclease of toxin-antitoxin system
VSHYLSDTHALLWHLSNDPRLSEQARSIFAAADVGTADVYVPTIAVVEAIYLFEKARVPQAIIDRILTLLDSPATRYHVVPLDLKVARALRAIDRKAIPDMPDRIIAATALRLGLPLLTRDAKIVSSGLITTVW